MAVQRRKSKLAVLLPCLSLSLMGVWGTLALPPGAQAAGELKVEGLPQEPEAYKQQVDRIVDRVDALIDKMKAEKSGDPALLELIQARDNVKEEALKVVYHPEEAKWTADEARESTDAMLKFMKAQYEKASAEMAG